MRNAIPRTRSGPAPDPNALRRDRPADKAEWFHLPASGREGDLPTWPLTRATKREMVIWARLWLLPQAVAWERGQYFDTVACYVRALRIGEGKAASADRTLVKQYQDTLGLTDAGIRANRWTITEAMPEKRVTRTDDPDRVSAKSRFQVLRGEAAS